MEFRSETMFLSKMTTGRTGAAEMAETRICMKCSRNGNSGEGPSHELPHMAFTVSCNT